MNERIPHTFTETGKPLPIRVKSVATANDSFIIQVAEFLPQHIQSFGVGAMNSVVLMVGGRWVWGRLVYTDDTAIDDPNDFAFAFEANRRAWLEANGMVIPSYL